MPRAKERLGAPTLYLPRSTYYPYDAVLGFGFLHVSAQTPSWLIENGEKIHLSDFLGRVADKLGLLAVTIIQVDALEYLVAVKESVCTANSMRNEISLGHSLIPKEGWKNELKKFCEAAGFPFSESEYLLVLRKVYGYFGRDSHLVREEDNMVWGMW